MTTRPLAVITKPRCPTCWQPAERQHTTTLDGVTVGNYVCVRGHGWMTKWVSS